MFDTFVCRCYCSRMSEPKDNIIYVRADTKWLEAVDRWRREMSYKQNRDITKSEAVRELVDQALNSLEAR